MSQPAINSGTPSVNFSFATPSGNHYGVADLPTEKFDKMHPTDWLNPKAQMPDHVAPEDAKAYRAGMAAACYVTNLERLLDKALMGELPPPTLTDRQQTNLADAMSIFIPAVDLGCFAEDAAGQLLWVAPGLSANYSWNLPAATNNGAYPGVAAGSYVEAFLDGAPAAEARYAAEYAMHRRGGHTVDEIAAAIADKLLELWPTT